MWDVYWSVLSPLVGESLSRWGVLVALGVAALQGVACASVLRRLDARVSARAARDGSLGGSAGPPGWSRSAADREPPMR